MKLELMMLASRLAPVFGAAALLAMPPAQAQIFVGGGANAAVSMPSAQPPAAAASPTIEAPAPTTVLRYLPNTLNGLRVTGESGALHWPVTLTAAQARGARTFRLTYVSAISVLPDASWISVRVNERDIGRTSLDAADGLRTIALEIPAGVLEPGVNAISIALQQRHRVDCSLAATYELWTRIDPTQTGLVLGAETRDGADSANLADLAAVLPRADGGLPIHIVLSGKTNPAHLQRLIAATQAIALATHTLQPAVDFNATASDAFGVDLALGTRAALKQIPRLAGQLGVSGPLLRLVSSPSSRPTLIVTGTDEAEVDRAIAALADVAPPVGSAAGLALLARQPARASDGEASLSLADFGVRSQEFGGRLFRTAVDLRLPADFLASDYGRGTFDLAGGYAAGLARGAQVRIDVNGRNAGIVKLPDAEGGIFRHNQLFLPLGLMRPGLNRIEVIAEVPRPEDAACAQISDRRFLLLDSTRLVLPVLAHVQRLPDLALATAGALPYDRGIAHLVVPKPDRQTVAAALSLTARVAVAAGKPIPFVFSTQMPANDDGSTLVVSPVRQLDPKLMASIDLDPTAVEAAWHDRAALASDGRGSPKWWLTHADGPAACHAAANGIVSRPGASSPVATIPKETPSDDLLETWTSARAAQLSWGARLLAGAGTVQDWIGTRVRTLRLLAWSHEKATVIAPDSALLLAQGMSPGSSTHVTTIVTAPTSAALLAASACLVDPQVWPRVRGRLAALDARTGDVMTMQAASYHYVASGRPSLGNSRLVFAGWLSLNPLAFAGIALMTALCLSGTTLWFVRGVGRRSE